MPVRPRKAVVSVVYRPDIPRELTVYRPGAWIEQPLAQAGSDAWERQLRSAYQRWLAAGRAWWAEHGHKPSAARSPLGDVPFCGDTDEHECGGADCVRRRPIMAKRRQPGRGGGLFGFKDSRLAAELADALRTGITEIVAHHEAGHIVAAISRGGEMSDVCIELDHPDVLGYVDLEVKNRHQAFVTYGGPFAEARFIHAADCCTDIECGGFLAALVMAWDDNEHGDTAMLVRDHSDMVAALGGEDSDAGLGYRASIPGLEADWRRELAALWPAIAEVAQRLIGGCTVTGADVVAVLAGYAGEAVAADE